jgi:hypothetical protein
LARGVETTLAARQLAAERRCDDDRAAALRVRTRSLPPCLDASLGVATTEIEAIARERAAPPKTLRVKLLRCNLLTYFKNLLNNLPSGPATSVRRGHEPLLRHPLVEHDRKA